ncbi:uncharacterized protein J4E88_000873 [Alternaria novae-zelandiae]|uniref:uncharacterized protein n=2 Tax=Alternaria sect. Infectoriae TaxID=2499258 RepID=UPI0020C3038C|nr:uncharacterized protein J4E88_000873 [Alternaria novae-zelandiae]KAI4696695.1 hypothetical protein J4E88_000873 [Alternaria novae-zelandiae]
MAIATGIPGFEVTIEVDAAALPEHQHGIIDDDEVATSTSRYIEAPSAANFSIRYLFRPPFTPPSAVQMDVLLDGNYVQAPFVEWGGKEECEGYLCSRSTSSTGGHSFTQGFHFAELRTDETNIPMTKDLADRLSPIGRIVLYFYFIEHLEAVRPAEVPQLPSNKFDVLSEKALHKAAAMQGDQLSHQTSLTAPEQRDTITYNEVKTTENEPFATFTFYYRSTDALKSIGVIPRTPSPSPEPELEAEDRDPEDMTEEELRAVVRSMREKKQKAITIKREREEEREGSEDTLVGDEVEWIGSQPAHPIVKRIRRMPGPDDEVVALDD